MLGLKKTVERRHAPALLAQEAVLEDQGSAVKRSLDRSRQMYPDAARCRTVR